MSQTSKERQVWQISLQVASDLYSVTEFESFLITYFGLDRPFIIEMVGLDNLSEVRFDIMKFCCCCLPNIGALAPTDPVAKSLPYLLIILAGILVVTV